jgi:hypothetical protein
MTGSPKIKRVWTRSPYGEWKYKTFFGRVEAPEPKKEELARRLAKAAREEEKWARLKLEWTKCHKEEKTSCQLHNCLVCEEEEEEENEDICWDELFE